MHMTITWITSHDADGGRLMREEEVRGRQREGQSCYETKSESHLFTMYTPSMGMAMDTTHHSPVTPLTSHHAWTMFYFLHSRR